MDRNESDAISGGVLSMERRRRTRVLVEDKGDLLARLCEYVEENFRVQIHTESAQGCVMAKGVDSVHRIPFFMGEVLISECTVRIDNVMGFGAVLGDDTQKAYRLAAVDAAWNKGVLPTTYWISRLKDAEAEIVRRHRQESAAISESRVHFETAGEYDNSR